MIADICIVAIIVLFIYNGYSKGFIKSVYSILSLVVTLVLVSVFKDSFLKVISESPIATSIAEFFSGSSAGEELNKICSEGITYLISIVVLYFIVRVVLRFALTIINSIASLPLINSLNKILGLAIGAVIGVLWVVVIVNVFSVIPQTADYINSSNIADFFKII